MASQQSAGRFVVLEAPSSTVTLVSRSRWAASRSAASCVAPMSVAYTRPSGPSHLENLIVHAPKPAPTSATVMPGFSSSNSTSRGTSISAALSCPSVSPVCWATSRDRNKRTRPTLAATRVMNVAPSREVYRDAPGPAHVCVRVLCALRRPGAYGGCTIACPMKLLTNIPVVSFALALLVPVSSVESQPRGPQRGTRAGVEARTFALTEPIPFHGAQLVGFERGAALKTATGVVRPSDPALVFVTIKLELASPFEYVRGRFREITLTDEGGQVYRYRGWLTDEGWVQIDA